MLPETAWKKMKVYMTRKHKLCCHSQQLSDQYRISNWYVSPLRSSFPLIYFFWKRRIPVTARENELQSIGPSAEL